MKKILAIILASCGLAAGNANAGELRVLANTPTGEKTYIVPVDGSLAPTVNLAVPRNTQSLLIGYAPAPQSESVAAVPAEAAAQPEVDNVSNTGETYANDRDAAEQTAPVRKEAPKERTRLYLSAKAGFGFLKIKEISMTTRQATYDHDPALPPGVAWLEDSAVMSKGGNQPRGLYAYAVGLEVPIGFGAFRFEFEYNESDNHLYSLYSSSSEEPMRLTLAPKTQFFNLYWDWPGFYRRYDGGVAVRPYFGAGIGMSKIRAHAVWEDYSIGVQANMSGEKFYADTRAISRDGAYNFSAGVAFAIGAHLALDFGWRHVNYGTIRGVTENFFSFIDSQLGEPKPTSISNIETKTRANEFFGGLRVSL